MNIFREGGDEHHIRRSLRYSPTKCSLGSKLKHICCMLVPGHKDKVASSLWSKRCSRNVLVHATASCT
uniref:Uncharacterized protein n=1 Tax=Arundo donax TaxID=35708 RepID=A0A0A9H309_ARUDO